MQFKKSSVFLAVAAVMAAGLFAEQAQAAPMTFTTSGTITAGTDVDGTFTKGVTNASLVGDAYTDTITVDPTKYATQTLNAQSIEGIGSLSGGTATETVTINGISETFMLNLSATNSGETYLLNTGSYAEAFQNQDGTATDGATVSSQFYVEGSLNPNNLALNFTQNWSYAVQPGNTASAYVAVDGTNAGVDFTITTANVTSVSINDVAKVPEPMTPALIGLGLLALAVARRSGRSRI